MTEPSRSEARRAFVADTLALLLFFTATGNINELFIANMSWEQVMQARLIGAVLIVPVARPYGVWRDWMVRHARPTRRSQLALGQCGAADISGADLCRHHRGEWRKRQ